MEYLVSLEYIPIDVRYLFYDDRLLAEAGLDNLGNIMIAFTGGVVVYFFVENLFCREKR
jgi:hypothetical protein